MFEITNMEKAEISDISGKYNVRICSNEDCTQKCANNLCNYLCIVLNTITIWYEAFEGQSAC